jgi:hypothetical protein
LNGQRQWRPGDHTVNTSKHEWSNVALKFEAATLHAIDGLSHGDRKSQALACLRWDDALAELKALTYVEYNRANLFLNDRGRLTSDMPEIIRAVVQRFVDEVNKWQAN